MGQRKWDQFNQSLGLYMDQNGIKSLQGQDAGNLRGLKADTEAQLRAQYPAWAEHMDTLDRGLRDRQITAVASMLDAPGLKGRTDIEDTRKYLMARQALIDYAHQNGISQWNTSNALYDQRQALRQYAQSLASSDLVFGTAWSNLFDGEFKQDDRNGPPQTKRSVNW